MKQTAVEWLVDKLNRQGYLGTFCTKEEIEIKRKDMEFIINQAKEIEEEQIIMAYKADWHPCSNEDAEQYYNKTYKQYEQNK